MDYSDRKISKVLLNGIRFARTDKSTWVSSTVAIQLSNHVGQYDGPDATLTFSAEVDSEDPTLREAEEALLTVVPALFKRLAAETPETLMAGWRAHQEEFP